MGLSQYVLTLRRILRHPRPALPAMVRHFGWHLRRRSIGEGFRVQLSDQSFLWVDQPAAANGTTALSWILGLYDYNNMSLIRELLSAKDGPRRMLDIGANIGTYALVASESPGAVVHAFEPHPATAAILETNLKRNGRSNVTVARVALSSSNGTTTLTDDAGSTVNRLMDSGEQGIAVERVTADDYCRNAGLVPELIKLDVEGHELEVLAGMQEVLAGAGLLFVEVNHSQADLRALIPALWKGPWLVDYEGRRLREAGDGMEFEDTVFVSPAFTGQLKAMGFQLPGL